MTIKQARKKLFLMFEKSSSKRLDADCILSHFLRVEKTFLISHGEKKIPFLKKIKIFCAAKKRALGFPIAYITKKKEFFGRDFFVSPDVLIPKPDTELLVEKSVQMIKQLNQSFCESECKNESVQMIKRLNLSTNEKSSSAILAKNSISVCNKSANENVTIVANKKNVLRKKKLVCGNDRKFGEGLNSCFEPLELCDMCAGSGCVGISIVLELLCASFPAEKIRSLTFCDISLRALKVAKKNAKKLLPKNVLKKTHFVKTDIFSAFKNGKKFDVIFANPPYIPKDETEKLLLDGRSEPRIALSGGRDGFLFLEKLANQTKNYLTSRGIFLCEIGFGQEKKMHTLLKPNFKTIICEKDFSSIPRVFIAFSKE